MSVTNIRTVDLSDDDPMKELLMSMGMREEQNYIDSAKRSIENGEITSAHAKQRLISFMNLWPNGSRKFYLIPNYIATL